MMLTDLSTLAGLLGTRYAYVASFVVASVGLYVVVADANLVKKVVGLNLFQTGVFLFFVSAAAVAGGSAPLTSAPGPYVNPLPHVLILTAIVVGVSLTALALALVVRVHATYGSIDDDAVRAAIARGGTSDDTAERDAAGRGTTPPSADGTGGSA